MGISLKQRVLDKLNANRGTFYSGQELADCLGVTRAAVWKAIAALRQEGYTIDAVTNLGYRLAPQADVLSAQAILDNLSVEVQQCIHLEYQEVVPGTNQLLKKAAENGALEGCILVAGEQTSGRGRRVRSVYTPGGSGVYVSILLRPNQNLENTGLLTVLAAVAAARAAEALQKAAGLPEKKVQIKWVNDLMQQGKKVCGILSEAATDVESGSVDYVVVGTGFNLYPPPGGWPKELKEIAGALLPADRPVAGARALLAAMYIQQFWKLYTCFNTRQIIDEYRDRQYILGQRVCLLRPGADAVSATALDIGDNGGLWVQHSDGTTQLIRAGEVSLKKEI